MYTSIGKKKYSIVWCNWQCADQTSLSSSSSFMLKTGGLFYTRYNVWAMFVISPAGFTKWERKSMAIKCVYVLVRECLPCVCWHDVTNWVWVVLSAIRHTLHTHIPYKSTYIHTHTHLNSEWSRFGSRSNNNWKQTIWNKPAHVCGSHVNCT